MGIRNPQQSRYHLSILNQRTKGARLNKILEAYYKGALALKLPVTYIEEIRSLNIQFNKTNYFLVRGITQLNNASSMYISNNKKLMKTLLHDAGIPVPNGVTIHRNTFPKFPLPKLIDGLKFPLVAKPAKNTNSGTDVLCNIKNHDELSLFLEKNFKTHPYMLVEEYHAGLKEYRVLVLKGRVIGVVQRFAPGLIGDGDSTIRQLVTSNNNLIANNAFTDSPVESPTSIIEINEDCINCLKDQGLTLDSIPKKGQAIKLRHVVNRAMGGHVCSIGKTINRENASFIEKTANITGLELVGIDVLCEDINKPFSKSKWMILETNFPPDITLHEAPDAGKAINVSKQILKQIIYRHPVAYLIHRLKLLFGGPLREHYRG